MLKRTLILLIALLLSACATIPADDIVPNKKLTWSERQKELTTIKKWQVTGAIGLTTPKKAYSASINWQQAGLAYNMRLFGPLGAGQIKLIGTPNKVTMSTADNKHYSSSNAQTLLLQRTGWHLPVENLIYWIKGIPVPGVDASKTFDAFNRLTDMKQDGWHIQFKRYTSSNGVNLPNKIFLSNRSFKVKLVIKRWRVLP